MAKNKRFEKIEDLAAKAVFWTDDALIRFDLWLVKALQILVNLAAALITMHDNIQLHVDRRIFIVQYYIAKAYHKLRKKVVAYSKELLRYFAGGLLIAIGVVTLFSYATGFEYSYNGKHLGYVKHQEDVTKVLGLVSEELSKEYGSTIQINEDSDITFTETVILDKEIDNIDAVLKKLTYMSDMKAKACGIYIDNGLYVIVESEEAANKTLKNIQSEFMEKESDKLKYEKASFKENVEIKPIDTRLAYISSSKQATKKILTGGEKEVTYTIKNGDTIYEICEKLDVTWDEIKKMNPGIKEESIYPGDKILLNRATAAVNVVTVEKKTFAEKIEYKTKYEKSDEMYEGDSKVIQEGENGKRVVTARITRENGEIIKRKDLDEKVIKKPTTKIIVKGTKERPKTLPTGVLKYPVYGATLTSEFGWRWGRNHDGVDWGCPTGTPLYAADGGTVVHAGWYYGYGLYIRIDHGSGVQTAYAHCNELYVSTGDKVYQGQHIAASGNTGNSTGPHLHFEVLVNGSPQDPFNYLH